MMLPTFSRHRRQNDQPLQPFRVTGRNRRVMMAASLCFTGCIKTPAASSSQTLSSDDTIKSLPEPTPLESCQFALAQAFDEGPVDVPAANLGYSFNAGEVVAKDYGAKREIAIAAYPSADISVTAADGVTKVPWPTASKNAENLAAYSHYSQAIDQAATVFTALAQVLPDDGVKADPIALIQSYLTCLQNLTKP